MEPDPIKGLSSQEKDDLLREFLLNNSPTERRNSLYFYEQLIEAFDPDFYQVLREYEYNPQSVYEKLLYLEATDPAYLTDILRKKEVSAILLPFDRVPPELTSFIMSYVDTATIKAFCSVSSDYRWLCSPEGWALILQTKDPILYRKWNLVHDTFAIPAKDLFENEEIWLIVNEIYTYLLDNESNTTNIVRTAVIQDFFDVFQFFLPTIKLTDLMFIFEGFYEAIQRERIKYLDYVFIITTDQEKSRLIMEGLALATDLEDYEKMLIYFLKQAYSYYQTTDDKVSFLYNVFEAINENADVVKSLYYHRDETPIIDLLYENYGPEIALIWIDDLETIMFMVSIQDDYETPFITRRTLQHALQKYGTETFNYLRDLYPDL